MKAALVLLCSVSALLPSVYGWGHVGHFVTAAIAEASLDMGTAALARKILGKSMGDVASWPDQVKHYGEWRWTSSLHFCDAPDFQCGLDYERDCHDLRNNPGICVLAAIHNYTSALQGSHAPTSARLLPVRSHDVIGLQSPDPEINPHNLNPWQLLTFLIHYVGDLHQPLHAGHKGDLGGNRINVTFFNHHTELHAVWDDGVLAHRMTEDFSGDQDDYVHYMILKAETTSAYHSPVSNCTDSSIPCLVAWGTESAKDACKYAYEGIKSGDVLGDEYYARTLPVIEDRLVLGGLRLAHLIKEALG